MCINAIHTPICIIKTRQLACTRSHNLLTLARTKTYIWQTVSQRVGQLAGIKLDPWVPHCSMGLKAILKASPTVLHQWESMESGQGKQPGASHTPGGLHLLSLYTLAPLCSAWHIVPCAHMPVAPDYTCSNTRPWCSTLVINLSKYISDYVHQVFMWLCVCLHVCDWWTWEIVCAYACRGHLFAIYGSAYKCSNHTVCWE